MKTSLQLIALGVGAWMAVVGNIDAGYAQPSSGKPQNDPEPPPMTPTPSVAAKRTMALSPAKSTSQPKSTSQRSSHSQSDFSRTAVRLDRFSQIPNSPSVFRAVTQNNRKSDLLPVLALKQIKLAQKPAQLSLLAQGNPNGSTPLPPSGTPGSAPKPAAPQPAPAGSPTPNPQPAAPQPAPAAVPVPQPATPTPANPPAPTPNTPTPGAPTSVPAPAGTPSEKLVPVPEFLKPSPNPLQFPTRPSEVQVRATQPITLRQALELAERVNRDLEIARLQLERNRAVVREARSGNFPRLALTAGLQRSGSVFIQPVQRSFFGENEFNDTRTTFAPGLQLDYDLFTSGLRPAQIREAERRARDSELQLEQTREEVRLQIATDYYNLQNADEQVRINEAAVRNAEANLRDSRAQERAGLGTRFDVLRAEVNLADAQQRLTEARSQQAVQRRQLVRRLNLSEAVNVVAADPVQQAGNWTLPLEESIVLAYKNRSELERQLVQRDITQEQIRAARAENGPTLRFQAQYQYNRTTISGSAAELQQQESRTDSTDNYALSLQAQWNLFDGGAANARIQQRARDRDIAEASFAQFRNQVRFEVEQAYSQLQANLLNIATTERSVTQAEEALRLAILRFQAGVGTQTDRINAETELTRARGNRVRAIVGYNLSLAQLQRAVSNIAR